MKTNLKFIVAIPTINRADLLNEALAHYFEDFPNTEIVICDNGKQHEIITRENQFVIYRPEKNLGVAGSWNMLMDYAIKTNATHVLMLNDDIYLGKTEAEIFELLRFNLDVNFFNSFQNWSAFILSVSGFKQVGNFDESFGNCYFEDNDYFYRMQLLQIQDFYTAFLNPVIYRNSQTIQKDPTLNSAFLDNKAYYIKKWGGAPSFETYKTPFNR